MHAGWNLLARYKRPETAMFSRMLTVIVLAGFVPAVLSEILTHSLSPKAWLCVVGSGLCCGVYFFYLARAYGSSDFTIVYPVARGLPVFFVAVGDVLRGRYPTAMGWIGMLLVICGCFLAPLYSFRRFTIRSYVNRTSLWMLLAALGTVGYSLLDKVASEAIQQGPATAARYGYVFFLVSFAAYTVLSQKSKTQGQYSGSVGWRFPFFAACLNFGAYWLVLWAYQLSRHASYIVAFRQFSIVIGTILGFAIYKESGKLVRVTAIALMAGGLAFIAFGGG